VEQRTIELSKKDIAAYTRLLQRRSALPYIEREAVIVTLPRAYFDAEVYAEITIVNSVSGPYVNATLTDMRWGVCSCAQLREQSTRNRIEGSYFFEDLRGTRIAYAVVVQEVSAETRERARLLRRRK